LRLSQQAESTTTAWLHKSTDKYGFNPIVNISELNSAKIAKESERTGKNGTSIQTLSLNLFRDFAHDRKAYIRLSWFNLDIINIVFFQCKLKQFRLILSLLTQKATRQKSERNTVNQNTCRGFNLSTNLSFSKDRKQTIFHQIRQPS